MKKTNITKKTIAAALAAITMTGTFGTIAYADNEGISPEIEYAPADEGINYTVVPGPTPDEGISPELEYTSRADEGINYQLDPTEENTAPVETATAETTPVNEETVPAEETPAVEETAPAEETPAAEETAATEETETQLPDISSLAIPNMICCLSENSQKKVVDTILDLDNTLIDDLADMLPLGNTLTKPLKYLTSWMSSKTHEDEEQDDPIQDLSDKVDEGFNKIDTKFDDLNNRFDDTNSKIDQLGNMIDDLFSDLNSSTNNITKNIKELSEHSDVNAEWLRAMNDNSNRLTQCVGYLNDLNAKATGISGVYYQISGIESDTERTDLEKLIDIAALSHDPTMKSLTEKLDIISDNIYERTGTLNTNFFDAITVNNYKDVMFSQEAYELSANDAEIIVEQYLTSAMLYLRTLEAENTIASFSRDELVQLSDEYIDLWNQVKKQGSSSIELRYDRVKKDIEKVLTAYVNYVEDSTSENRYIDHGKANYNVKSTTRQHYGFNYRNLNKKSLDNSFSVIYNGNVLKADDMMNIYNYAATNYPDMTMGEYLKSMGISVPYGCEIMLTDIFEEDGEFYYYSVNANDPLNIKRLNCIRNGYYDNQYTQNANLVLAIQ